jgi:hypothetical protein
MEGDASGYNNRLIEAWKHVQILRNHISFCVKFEDLYIVEIELKGSLKQFMIILVTSVRKKFGKSDMAEAFLRQQIQSLQVELVNLQTQTNSGRPTTTKDLSFASLIP